jgi:hypothetical protein
LSGQLLIVIARRARFDEAIRSADARDRFARDDVA